MSNPSVRRIGFIFAVEPYMLRTRSLQHQKASGTLARHNDPLDLEFLLLSLNLCPLALPASHQLRNEVHASDYPNKAPGNALLVQTQARSRLLYELPGFSLSLNSPSLLLMMLESSCSYFCGTSYLGSIDECIN